MKTNQEYKNAALAALKGKWAPAVICAVVYAVIACAISLGTELVDANSATGVLMTASLSTMLLSLLVVSPLGVGYYNVHKDLLLNGDDKLTENSFKIGFSNWAHNVWGMFLIGIVRISLDPSSYHPRYCKGLGVFSCTLYTCR